MVQRRRDIRLRRTDAEPTDGSQDGTDESDGDDAAINPGTSLDDLISEADPEEFGRTFQVDKDDVPLAVGSEFPLPLPLQGIPRIAAVVNLNYVYDEEAQRWVKKKVATEEDDGTTVVGDDPSAFGIVVVADQLDSTESVPAVDQTEAATETNLDSSVAFT